MIVELTYEPDAPFPLQPGDVLLSWFDCSTHEDLLQELFEPRGPMLVMGWDSCTRVSSPTSAVSLDVMLSDGRLSDCDAFLGDSFVVARQPPGWCSEPRT